MSYEYSENELVQKSAAALLHEELGWDTFYAYTKEKIGKAAQGDKMSLGRENYREIVLWQYFRAALKKLNSWITPQQISEAQAKLATHLSSASLMQINEEKYFLIRDGISVTVCKENGETDTRAARIIDFNNAENNSFLAVSEMKIHGEIYRRRTDIVGFVNGLPLLFIELKRSDVDVKAAYLGNYRDYLDTIPHLFYYNAFLILSNGLEAKVGTLGSKYEFFHEWKRLSEDEPGSVALETMLRGICKKENFLDLLENFILYDHTGGRTTKILARNHQYLGVNEAVKAYAARKLNAGKLGVFWHTQGAGKSYSMVFMAKKIRRKFTGSPTIVVLTDRDELNKQISGTFENCGLLGKLKASKYMAASGTDLVEKLQANPSFIFTLIQKFNQPDAQPLHLDHDVLIMSDEAHRSQYGIFAENMMRLLPEASRIGFTGTPLLSSDNITVRTFGNYVSIYDFKRAVEDHATVPLYYENRAETLSSIENPQITNEILDAIERADLDPDQQEKLEREFAKEIHILTAEPRLRAIARDFARHYSYIWTSGKAMFVCLNKVTCVRMYNYVQEYWQEEIKRLERELPYLNQQETQELEKKLEWMRQTEMCVVISQEQNEMQTFQKWGLDILSHRQKMEKRELDKEFKDPDNPFRVVFVCAMWLTGFDVKCLSCLYMDKPLKAHTLMQAIARANRVAEGKSNGLVIDYIGIVKALRKALADYTVNKEGQNVGDPTVDKTELLRQLREAMERAEGLLAEHAFSLQDLLAAEGFEKLSLLQEGANAISETPELRKAFLTFANEIHRLLKYVEHDELEDFERRKANAILALRNQLSKKRKIADNTNLMVEINSILGEYITVEEVCEDRTVYQSKRFDISRIDFDLLSREFARARHRNLLLKDLSELVAERLARMLIRNPSRIDYEERYQEIIEAYNKEQDRAAIEKTFMDLMDLANSLNEEEKRYVREGFECDEELSIYDLLFREDLSKGDIAEIKKVAKELLRQIKEKIARLDHWQDKPNTQSQVDNLIGKILWENLPESYEDNSLPIYRQRVYEYVFTHYSHIA